MLERNRARIDVAGAGIGPRRSTLFRPGWAQQGDRPENCRLSA